MDSKLNGSSKTEIPKLFEYRKYSRRYWLHYLLVAAGALFMYLAWNFGSQPECNEHNCPSWIRYLAGIVGFLFSVGGGMAILRKWQWGSRVDLQTQELIWWASYPPVVETRIPMQKIGTISIDGQLGDTVLRLLDQNGDRIHFPQECAPWPLIDWARELQNHFPHLEITEK